MQKETYIVTGFMRTGTSMMMRSLIDGGLDAKYKDKKNNSGTDPNPNGFYELPDIARKSKDFPRQFKGKLIKVLWKDFPKMNVMEDGMHVVIMRRDPEEVKGSFKRSFGRNLGLTNERIEEIYDDLIAHANNRKDVLSVTVVDYDDAVYDPENTLKKVKKSGLPIDEKKAMKRISPTLKRTRYYAKNS